MWRAEECAPAATHRPFLLEDTVFAGQQVLTRSHGEGACVGAPGMPELFLGLTEVGAREIAQECAVYNLGDDYSFQCSLNW